MHQASTADWPAVARNPGRATSALKPETAWWLRICERLDQLLAVENDRALEAAEG